MGYAIKRWWDEKRRDGFCDQEMMRWEEEMDKRWREKNKYGLCDQKMMRWEEERWVLRSRDDEMRRGDG